MVRSIEQQYRGRGAITCDMLLQDSVGVVGKLVLCAFGAEVGITRHCLRGQGRCWPRNSVSRLNGAALTMTRLNMSERTKEARISGKILHDSELGLSPK